MAQYCTIQEAYNIPSFPRKKKTGCYTENPRASADPYDPFSEQNAREQTMYEHFQDKSQGPPNYAETLAAENAQYKTVYSSKQLAGDAVPKPGRGMGGDPGVDGARNTYREQLTDYDYVCRTTGICPLGNNKKESFQNYETVPPQKPQSQKQTKSPQQSCAPLNPPNYEYPLSDKDKEKFRNALKVALEEMEDGPKNYTPREVAPRVVDMNNVSGYVDEELDSYLSFNEFKPAVKKEFSPTAPEKLKDVVGTEKPFKPEPSYLEKDVAVSQKKLDSFTKKNKIWMDLLLFISSGILIIFLLEQLFKLALITGMKKTVEAMELILKETKNTELPN